VGALVPATKFLVCLPSYNNVANVFIVTKRFLLFCIENIHDIGQCVLTWQESWPPFSCPAHRKISGMNSCRPARRNMDLQQSLLTMGTDTYNQSIQFIISSIINCSLLLF